MSRRLGAELEGKRQTLIVAADVASNQAGTEREAIGYANGLRHAVAMMTDTKYAPLGLEVKPEPVVAAPAPTPAKKLIDKAKDVVKKKAGSSKKAATKKKVTRKKK